MGLRVLTKIVLKPSPFKVTLYRQDTYHQIHEHEIYIIIALKALVRLKKGTQYDRYTTSLCVNFKILIVFLLRIKSHRPENFEINGFLYHKLRS